MKHSEHAAIINGPYTAESTKQKTHLTRELMKQKSPFIVLDLIKENEELSNSSHLAYTAEYFTLLIENV